MRGGRAGEPGKTRSLLPFPKVSLHWSAGMTVAIAILIQHAIGGPEATARLGMTMG